MHRGKRIILLSHCILNQNTVVAPLARAKGAYTKIIQQILESEIGIHQLPCPEFNYLGVSRKPMSKLEYECVQYRDLCKKYALETVKALREYLDNQYEILGIVGIQSSPSCGIHGERGILMEELFAALEEEKIRLNTFEISTEYLEGEPSELHLEAFKGFLNEGRCSLIK